MKYILLALLLFGCVKKQICFVTPIDQEIKKDSLYVFENDTLRIRYAFWGDRGLIGFSVFNKLSKPLYIDWKKSSFVINGVKNNYWSDRTIVSSRGASLSMPVYPSYGWYGSVGGSMSEVVSPERITFLAPRSLVIRYSNALWSGAIKPLPASASAGILYSARGHRIQTKQVEYSPSGSPLNFRNFLTFSLTENFANESYVDNGFYVSKIAEVKPGEIAPKWHESSDGKHMVHDESFRLLTGFYLSTTPENQQ